MSKNGIALVTKRFRDPAVEEEFRGSQVAKLKHAGPASLVVFMFANALFLPLDWSLPADTRTIVLTCRAIIMATSAVLWPLFRHGEDWHALERLLGVAAVTFYTCLLAIIYTYPASDSLATVVSLLVVLACALGWQGRYSAGLAGTFVLALACVGIIMRPKGDGLDMPPLDEGIAAACILVTAAVGLMQAGRQQYSMRHDFLMLRRERALAAELEVKRREAEAAAKAKSDFLAVMSHEIRTPMNGVLGLALLVLDTPLTPDQREKLETMHYSAEALLGILDDILDFSKLEAGRLEFEHIPFDLRRTIEAALHLMDSRASQKRLSLRAEMAADLPQAVSGDPVRLRQVLLNLLGNAVKFTETGGVTLRVRREEAPEGRASILFEVEDTGIGMDEEARSRLFQSFTQADSSISRRYGGSGLGLAICRKLVEGQGGNIGAHSAPGQGSTFWFRLEFDLAETVPARHRSDLSAAPLPPLDVLLAEDNPVNQKVAMGFLSRGGHRVTIAPDGAQAVELAATRHFDVVLMDMQMPNMDGLEATRAIRALPDPVGRVPIVALTANAMRGDEERCRAAGMDAHVAKPIDPAKLFSAMASVLNAAGEQATDQPEVELPPVDPSALATLAQYLGEEAVVELVGLFLKNGAEACGRLSAVEGDLEVARAAAHDLKGMSGYLGCRALAELAAAIEEAARDCRPDEVARLVAKLPNEWAIARSGVAGRVPMPA